jgi:signal transduction histidine kinase
MNPPRPTGETRSGHWTDGIRTLRFRLVFWNTLVLFLIVSATLAAVREGVRLSLYQEFENQLREDMGEVLLTIRQIWPDEADLRAELERKAVTHRKRGWWARFYNPAGEIVWASANAPYPVLPVDPLKVPMDEIVSYGSYRMIHRRLGEAGLPDRIVRVGVNLEAIEADLSQLTRLIVMVGCTALLLAPIGGYFLASQATRPVAQIIETANRLQPQALSERLPIRGTRDELDRLSDTINRLLDRIAAYLAQNREFTANAAHELRSPLAAMQSSLEISLNAERSSADYQERMADLLDQCIDLGKLVNQLLYLAEADAGLMRLEPKPVPLNAVIERAVQMFRGAAEVAGIELIVARLDRVHVSGDQSRLSQVLNNLIDNGLKFTPEGGRVSISLTANFDTKRAILSVTDTGSGIAPDDLPHVFERFYRADKSRSRTEGPRGTGLGLSICEAIVRSHGGRMSVQSVAGQGTTFVVDLPLSNP